MLLFALITDWLRELMLPCFYKSIVGIDCPGCGMQRAFILLLEGEFVASLKMYPPLIPILIMFAFLLLHLVKKFEKGGTILKYLFLLNTSIIFFNYLYKMIILFQL